MSKCSDCNTDCAKESCCESSYGTTFYPRAEVEKGSEWEPPTYKFKKDMRVKNPHTKEIGVVESVSFKYVNVCLEQVETEDGLKDIDKRTVGFLPFDLEILETTKD